MHLRKPKREPHSPVHVLCFSWAWLTGILSSPWSILDEDLQAKASSQQGRKWPQESGPHQPSVHSHTVSYPREWICGRVLNSIKWYLRRPNLSGQKRWGGWTLMWGWPCSSGLGCQWWCRFQSQPWTRTSVACPSAVFLIFRPPASPKGLQFLPPWSAAFPPPPSPDLSYSISSWHRHCTCWKPFLIPKVRPRICIRVPCVTLYSFCHTACLSVSLSRWKVPWWGLWGHACSCLSLYAQCWAECAARGKYLLNEWVNEWMNEWITFFSS